MWGDINYLFHHPSGQTHLVNRAARDIILILQNAELSSEDVYRAVLNLYAAEDDPDFLESMTQLLAVLDNLGLIRCVQ